jgi:hydrogenase-4 component B
LRGAFLRKTRRTLREATQVISAVVLQLACVATLLAVALLAIALSRAKIASSLIYALTLLICAIACGASIRHLLGGLAQPDLVTLPVGLPWLGAHFRLDALAAFFLAVINCGGALASLYALGYGRHEYTPQRVLPFFPAFLAGMNLVLLADDAFSYLLSWEFMSLASWALVMAHHRQRGNARAGYVYLVMASFGTLALLLAFGFLAGPGGGYDFAAMRAAPHSPAAATLVLILMLLGAGSKAGLVPLHVWLPLAHPAAPSHVSALMSGVMTKVAIYGFIRVVFDLLGPPDWTSGLVVLMLGGVTAVMGILYALMEKDLKRLLAYSTIENVGIVFASLGLALAFQANHQAVPAALAFTAALFHALNHSLFKSLLFFGAGAVLVATGARDMEKLGGLIHRMPVTSVVFLIGSVAISALPPFNGFVSEWLIFQAVLQSPQLPQWGLKIMVPAIGGMLALAAALAAACFVKAYGTTFLSRPRSDAAAKAHEVDSFSLSAMAILAALCLLAGIFPGVVMDALQPVTAQLLHVQLGAQSHLPWLSIIPIDPRKGSYNGLLLLGFIALSASLGWLAIHRLASDATRRSPAWGCGFADAVPQAQYSPDSFAQPIRRVFGTLLFRARERVEMPPPGSTAPARFSVEVHDLVWEGVYGRIAGWVEATSTKLNDKQLLTIRGYLSLVFATLVALLLVLAIWS